MTSIYTTHYDPQYNLFGHPSVMLSDKVALRTSAGNAPLHTNLHIYKALHKLVQTKPTWRFIVTDGTHAKCNDGTHVYVATDFLLVEGTDKLGTVGLAYKGRSYRIMVENHRINEKRERGRGYYTDNPERAELSIRKHFYRRNVDELADIARQSAVAVLSSEINAKQSAKSSVYNALYKDSAKFVTDHFDMYLAERPQLAPTALDYKQKKAEFAVVADIKSVFDSGKALTVRLDGLAYIVKSNEGTKTLTAYELSEDVRRKLGLLKLVQDKQMISGVGCRISETVFVLLPETEENA